MESYAKKKKDAKKGVFRKRKIKKNKTEAIAKRREEDTWPGKGKMN